MLTTSTGLEVFSSGSYGASNGAIVTAVPRADSDGSASTVHSVVGPRRSYTAAIVVSVLAIVALQVLVLVLYRRRVRRKHASARAAQVCRRPCVLSKTQLTSTKAADSSTSPLTTMAIVATSELHVPSSEANSHTSAANSQTNLLEHHEKAPSIDTLPEYMTVANDRRRVLLVGPLEDSVEGLPLPSDK
jgi:hypothetical protein